MRQPTSTELRRDTARMTARWAANYNGCGGQPPMSLARDVTTVGESGAYAFFRQVLGAMLLAVGALAAIGLLFAPAIIDLLAPGFDGERHALAADYVRIAAPYVALAGVVAVVAAVLNAQGRVVAVALGIAAFNAVLLAALAWIAAFDGAPPSVIGETLAHAIVLAGIAQLVVTGVGFLHLRRGRTLSGEADTGSPQKVR